MRSSLEKQDSRASGKAAKIVDVRQMGHQESFHVCPAQFFGQTLLTK
jgi:hypothetical protein